MDISLDAIELYTSGTEDHTAMIETYTSGMYLYASDVRHVVDGESYIDVHSHAQTANYSIQLNAEDIGSDVGYLLIDLDDSTQWPHSATGYCALNHYRVAAIGDNTLAGEFHIGYVEAVHATDIDFMCVIHDDFEKSERRIQSELNYHPNAIVCTGTRHLGQRELTDTNFGSDIDTVATTGATPVEVGDIILSITRTAGTLNDMSITMGYQTYSGNDSM